MLLMPFGAVVGADCVSRAAVKVRFATVVFLVALFIQVMVFRSSLQVLRAPDPLL